MKWNPMNFSGRSVRLAKRVIEIDDVLDVKIVSGFKSGKSASKIFCLMPSFSVAASITKSDCATSRSASEGVMRANASDFSAALILPPLT